MATSPVPKRRRNMLNKNDKKKLKKEPEMQPPDQQPQEQENNSNPGNHRASFFERHVFDKVRKKFRPSAKSKSPSEPESPAPPDVRAMVADPLVWLQNHTRTKDSHWKEAGVGSPYRPFPHKPYFQSLVDDFEREPVLFVEKSRDMMASWLFVGLFTHAAMTTEGIEVLFQSQKEEKAFELVEYAKILYQQSDEAIRNAYPLSKGRQPDGVLEFAHGSRIIGIPGGGDQVRSYHPWGLFQDEAAFMPEAGEAYDNAVPVCEKIVVVSSAGPGWFANQCQNVNDAYSSLAHGLIMRRMAD